MGARGANAASTFQRLATTPPSILDSLLEGDVVEAFATLVDTPAALVGAFLNGGMLDISQLAALFGLDLGEDANFGLAVGGLLSPGDSIFNALDVEWTERGTIHNEAEGVGPGAIGSLLGLARAIAAGIGWDRPGGGDPPKQRTAKSVDSEPEPRQAADPSLVKSATLTVTVSPEILVAKVPTENTPSPDAEEVTVTIAPDDGEMVAVLDEAESEKPTNRRNLLRYNGPVNQIRGTAPSVREHA